MGQWGWRTRTIVDAEFEDSLGLPTILLPDLGDLPASLGVGMLGMPG